MESCEGQSSYKKNISGPRSEPISTSVVAFQPSNFLERRFKKADSVAIKKGNSFGRLKTKRLAPKLAKIEAVFPDLILMNEEFGCNDEIHVLPRTFGRLDSEFIGVRIGPTAGVSSGPLDNFDA